MTTTELSPAAQAILDAWENEWSKASLCHDQHSIAAVLRAAADQVAPFPGRYPMNEYMEGLCDAKQNVHHQLLAIAAELEGAS